MQFTRALRLAAVLTAAVCFLAPIPAMSAEEELVAEPEAIKANPNKRVCRKVKPTGSHIPARVCLKQREWDEMQRAAQATLRNSTDTAASTTFPSSPN